MADTFGIFISGIVGVFFGMTLLYTSIRVTSFVINKFTVKTKKDD